MLRAVRANSLARGYNSMAVCSGVLDMGYYVLRIGLVLLTIWHSYPRFIYSRSSSNIDQMTYSLGSCGITRIMDGHSSWEYASQLGSGWFRG